MHNVHELEVTLYLSLRNKETKKFARIISSFLEVEQKKILYNLNLLYSRRPKYYTKRDLKTEQDHTSHDNETKETAGNC